MKFADRAIILLAVLTAACGSDDNAPGPGGVTIGEARALDEAAEMIEQRRAADVDQPTGQASPEQ